MIGLKVSSVALLLSMATSSLGAPFFDPTFLGDIFKCACDASHPTTPPTTTPYPPQTCDNHGLAYAVQSHPYKNDFADFSSLKVQHFYTAPVLQTGLTTKIGFANGNPKEKASIYGGEPIDTESIGVNHRGYIVPTMTGMHTISSTSADDIMMLWIGENAYNGNYNRENVDCIASVGQPKQTCSTFLFEGEYYPVRILLVNGLGPVEFKLTVFGPDQKVIISDTTEKQSHFVQFSCDGKSPKFDAFGQEKSTRV